MRGTSGEPWSRPPVICVTVGPTCDHEALVGDDAMVTAGETAVTGEVGDGIVVRGEPLH